MLGCLSLLPTMGDSLDGRWCFGRNTRSHNTEHHEAHQSVFVIKDNSLAKERRKSINDRPFAVIKSDHIMILS